MVAAKWFEVKQPKRLVTRNNKLSIIIVNKTKVKIKQVRSSSRYIWNTVKVKVKDEDKNFVSQDSLLKINSYD